NTGMGWSVNIGSYGQFTPVSGGLSIRFLQVGSKTSVSLLMKVRGINYNPPHSHNYTNLSVFSESFWPESC
ncbi:MAG: hypothetical protein KAI99_09715, partial [Cyclobacteriaceae bacterium]|nr:hypothetical protein [Cyclobacteriaceae bacterium]